MKPENNQKESRGNPDNYPVKLKEADTGIMLCSGVYFVLKKSRIIEYFCIVFILVLSRDFMTIYWLILSLILKQIMIKLLEYSVVKERSRIAVFNYKKFGYIDKMIFESPDKLKDNKL